MLVNRFNERVQTFGGFCADFYGYLLPPGFFCCKDRSQVVNDFVSTREVTLVDCEDVPNFDQPGFGSLYLVSQLRHQDNDYCIGNVDYFDLGLTNSHRFDENDIKTGRIQNSD